MSDAEKPAFTEEILLLAESLGEAMDRLNRIEAEFKAQTAPIDAAKTTQDSALRALEAAVIGIKALDAHVLGNDLGKVSKRVEAVAEQADTAIKALSAQIAANEKALASAKDETAQKLAQTDAQRVELAAKRDADAKELAAKIDAVRTELAAQRDALTAQLQAAKREFAAPVGFNPRGEWDAQSAYARLDVVVLNGTSYVSQTSENREKPGKNSKSWQVLARRGSGGGGGISADEAVGRAEAAAAEAEASAETAAAVSGSGNGTFAAGTPVSIANTTASTSTTTGALKVAGGVGVAGAGYFAGIVSVAGATDGQLIITGNSSTVASRRLRMVNSEASGITVDLEQQSVANGSNFRVVNHSTTIPILTISPTGAITTAAPTTGTAGAWKLGIKVDATTTLDTTKYLQVDIGGTLYKLALVTS